MIYNMANTIEAGRPVRGVWDADGNRIYRQTLEVDTETGRVVAFKVRDGVGLTDYDGHLLREELHFKPPLRVVFRDESPEDPPEELAKYDRIKFCQFETARRQPDDAQLRDPQSQSRSVPGDQG